jgi:hypothetical protein
MKEDLQANGNALNYFNVACQWFLLSNIDLG